MAYGFKSGKNKQDVYTKTETDAQISAAVAVVSGDVATLVSTKQNKQKRATVTLVAGNWSANAQTVSCSIVGETDTVFVGGATPADNRKAQSCGVDVDASDQEDNRLKFVCTSVPDSNITVNVVALEV